MMQTKRCNRLDDFLMKKMLNSEKNYFSDEERYQAYRNFLRLTTKEGKRDRIAKDYLKLVLIYGFPLKKWKSCLFM